MDLGNAIKSTRKSKGISQQDLASSIGISTTFLSQIEKGHKDCSLSTLKRIAEALATPLPILMFLSMDVDDVPEGKKRVFELLNTPIKEFINAVIDDTESK